MKRRLSLKSEHLTELTRTDLAGVAGGIQEIPTRKCFTAVYPTINTPCRTVDDCWAVDLTPICPATGG